MSFVKQRLFKLIVSFAFIGVAALPAAAQQAKIGVVNIPVLLDRAPQTKAVMDSLQEEFAPRQREFLAKQKELEDLTARIQKDVAVMGESERRTAENDLRDLRRDVSRMQQEFREDIELRQNEELGKLQSTLLKAVQDYAQAQEYDLIVGDGVLFASSAVNITDEVLRAVEASFQAQGSR